jgi:hypothetical protein
MNYDTSKSDFQRRYLNYERDIRWRQDRIADIVKNELPGRFSKMAEINYLKLDIRILEVRMAFVIEDYRDICKSWFAEHFKNDPQQIVHHRLRIEKEELF